MMHKHAYIGLVTYPGSSHEGNSLVKLGERERGGSHLFVHTSSDERTGHMYPLWLAMTFLNVKKHRT